MSKATKLAKQKRSSDTRRPRRGRGHRNPLKVGQFPPNFAPTEVPPVIDMLIGLGPLMRGFIGSHRAERTEKCVCKGECLCHLGTRFAGPPGPHGEL